MFINTILCLFFHQSFIPFLVIVILLDSLFKVNDFCYVYCGCTFFDTNLIQNNIDSFYYCFKSTAAYYMQISFNLTSIRSKHLHYFFPEFLNMYPSFSSFRWLEDKFLSFSSKHFAILVLDKYYSEGRDVLLLDCFRRSYKKCSRIDEDGNVVGLDFSDMFSKKSVKSILAHMDIPEPNVLYGHDYDEIYAIIGDMIRFFQDNPDILKEFQLFAMDNNFHIDIGFYTDFQV